MQEQLLGAFALVERGLAVFPIRRDTKLPAIEGWQGAATDDPFQLADWFAASKRNVGVFTGRDLIVVDCDVKRVDGVANFLALAPDDIETFTVATPSGGRHFFFRGSPVRNSVEELAPGVDIRSKGGLVASLGSVIDGKPYTVVNDAPIAPAPEWLLREIVRKYASKAEAVKLDKAVELDTPGAIARAVGYLAAEADFPAEGSRNVAAYKIACRLKDFGLSEEAVLGLMEQNWNALLPSPMPGEELARTVQSSRTSGQNAPGSASLEAEFDDLGDVDEPAAAEKAEAPSRIKILFGPQIQAGEGQRREYIIKGVLAKGDFGIIFGKPGAGKSLLAPYLAGLIAQGKPAFGRRTQAGKALYVAAEDATGMAARIDALQRQIGVCGNLALVSGISNLTVKNGPDLAALIAAIKEHRPKVIIIDTMARAFPGIDENSSEGMGRVVEVCSGLAKSGAAVILIHHDTKAEGDTPRGHSILDGALDMKLKLTRDDAGVISGKLGKNRNGDLEWFPQFKIAVADFGVDSDGDRITAPYAAEIERAAPSAAAVRLGRAPRLTQSTKSALDILVRLDSETAGDVDKAAWKAACCDTQTAVSGAEAYRSRAKAWERAVTELLRCDAISIDDGYVILAGSAKDFEVLDGEPFPENKVETS